MTYAASTNDVSGLSTLSYNGTQLINDSNSQQEFQVDRYYTLNGDGSYTAVAGGYGFTHNWNPSTDTLTYTYSWGTLTCQYVQVGSNRLNLVFSVNNSATSGVTLGGLSIYPAYIHFPFTITPTDEQQIVGSPNPASPLWAPEVAYGVDGPAVVPADYSDAPTDDGAVMDLVNDGPATQQMYTSLFTTNYTESTPGKDYFLFVGTAPSGILLTDEAADTNNGVDTDTMPVIYTNTAPGQSDQFEVSLRFGTAGTPTTALATDIEQNYATAYPDLAAGWADKRPIASLHLASEGSATATNPNAWALGGYASSPIDVTTTAGLNNFSSGVLAYAAGSMAQMTHDHSQGMIVWDIEGEAYPQPNPSYLGDPNLATTIAPEWNYNYQGNGPLINQFFSAFTSAGFRVGVTLRPTQVLYNSSQNPPYSQSPNGGVGSVPEALEVSQLQSKIAYANTNWGCTLFYIDSTTGFDTAALRTVQQAYPNVLLIPEHNSTSTFGTAAPYGELTNDWVGTPSSVYATYPTAFSVIYIADGDMTNYASELLNSLKNGDIMLFRGWYADPNNAVMVSDYKQAMAVPGQTTVSAAVINGVVNLSWTALGGEAVYNIARSTSLHGTYTTIASGVFGSSYTDTTVSDYQTYYYIVTAVNGAGTGPASSAASVTLSGPTVVSPASASPATVTGSTTTLSVLGNDQGGPSSLKYIWTSTSVPANAPPPTFTVNGSNAASSTLARFYQAGTYDLTATISDPAGYVTTSSVMVTVNQTVTTLFVLPPIVTISNGSTQQYTVKATNQFSNTISSPSVTWSVSGGGTISTSGLFTANASAGTFVVTGVSGGVTATTTITLQPAPIVMLASALSSNQLIDVGNGDLIIPNGGSTALSQVQAEVKAGAILANGYWNGTSGITSSAAAGDITYLTALGVILNNSPNTTNPAAIYTTFDGTATGLNDVLVKYTYYGDANVDGKVDGSDYSLIDNGYLQHLTGWFNGDFNYDGVVDGSDYTLIDNAYNQQGGSIGVGSTPAASIADEVAAAGVTAKLPKNPVFSDTTIPSASIQSSTAGQFDDVESRKKQNFEALFD